MQSHFQESKASALPEWTRSYLAAGRVLVDIGQIDRPVKNALKREIRAGRLVSWRGKWHPVAGAPFGFGPDKTCYGTESARAAVAGGAS